jgi:dienelactone hydrolase
MMRSLYAWLCLALPAVAAEDFNAWMDRKAQDFLDARERAIARIQTPAQAEKRKEYVRAKILELIGGLPDYQGPLNPRVTGSLRQPGYTIENVIFESLPKYLVTANLYRPNQPGKFPGILLPLGHWENGKAATQRIAANLALKGFVVLAYDPVGQGERQQGYDRRLNGPLALGATTQHILAGAQSILMGESFARYRIWDAKRALDYLASRPEVDSGRIGCTGCSGGGTLTTYISALDSRIRVAAPACYMNSFRILFRGPVGDSEQSIPGFLAAGLDQTDYVELFAPKPWLILSTQQDFFTPAGAEIVYQEARRWYALYGAEDRIKWVVGPGPHGTPLEVREAIYEWMIRWLKDGQGLVKEQDVTLFPDHMLWATPSGQVALAGSRDLYEIIGERRSSQGKKADLKSYLRRLLSEAPAASLPDPPGTLATPEGAGPHPAVLLVLGGGNTPESVNRLAAKGLVALALTPRGLPVKPSSRPFIGDWLTNTRASMLGLHLPAMRARDILSGVDYLARRPDVRKDQIFASATGVSGIWLLMAAATDNRIAAVWLRRTPHSFRSALESPVHYDLHDAAVPGFALHWDIPDLIGAIAPRRVTWTDPVDWQRNVVRVKGDFRYSAYEAPEEDLPGYVP